MAAKASILIVDDDFDIAKVVAATLKAQSYRARHVPSADAAFAAIKEQAPDLILLDVGLPGISGFKFLEILKEQPDTAGIPVIMITNKGEESQKIKGLGGGADDYIVKPFSHKELLARVEALLRRVFRSGTLEDSIKAAGITIDFTRHEATVDGKKVNLRPMEFELLALLMRRKGQVLTLENLAASLSKGGQDLTSSNVYTHLSYLRDALGKAASRIETVHGVGYKFNAE